MGGTSDHLEEMKQICSEVLEVLPEYENNSEVFADVYGAVVMVMDTILSQLEPRYAKKSAKDISTTLLRLIHDRVANEKPR